MTYRQRLNNPNVAKRKTEKLGLANNFATLSLVHTTIAYTLLRIAGTRGKIRLSL